MARNCKKPLTDKTKSILTKKKGKFVKGKKPNFSNNVKKSNSRYKSKPKNSSSKPKKGNESANIIFTSESDVTDEDYRSNESEYADHIYEIDHYDNQHYDDNITAQSENDETVNWAMDTVSNNESLKQTIIDSGASLNITPFKNLLIKPRRIKHPIIIKTANKKSKQLIAKLVGDLRINFIYKGKRTPIVIKNVYYAKNSNLTLLSLNQLNKIGLNLHFKKGKCIVYKKNKIIASITPKDNLYYVYNINKEKVSYYDLHKKLGHISYNYIDKLLKNKEITNFKVIDTKRIQCQECLNANIKRITIPKYSSKEICKNYGEKLHIDIWGPA